MRCKIINSIKFVLIFVVFGGALISSAQAEAMYFEFAYDVTVDNQNAVILDYKLSANGESLVAAHKDWVEQYGGLKREDMFQQDPLPTDFYVKWKNSFTHIEHDRSVDLRGKIPLSIDHCTFYFTIVDDRLSIYIATFGPRKSDQPPVGPPPLQSRNTVLIYSN